MSTIKKIPVCEEVHSLLEKFRENNKSPKQRGKSKYDHILLPLLQSCLQDNSNEEEKRINIDIDNKKNMLKKTQKQVSFLKENLKILSENENKMKIEIDQMNENMKRKNKNFVNLQLQYTNCFSIYFNFIVLNVGKSIYENESVNIEDVESYESAVNEYGIPLVTLLKQMYPKRNIYEINIEFDRLLYRCNNKYNFPIRILTKKLQKKRLGKYISKVLQMMGSMMSVSWINQNSPVKVEYKNADHRRDIPVNKPTLTDVVKNAKDYASPESKIFYQFLGKRYNVNLKSDLKEEFNPHTHQKEINKAKNLIISVYNSLINISRYDNYVKDRINSSVIQQKDLDGTDIFNKYSKLYIKDLDHKKELIDELKRADKRKEFDSLTNIRSLDELLAAKNIEIPRFLKTKIKKTKEFIEAIKGKCNLTLLDSFKILHRIKFNMNYNSFLELNKAHQIIGHMKSYEMQKLSGSKNVKTKSIFQKSLFDFTGFESQLTRDFTTAEHQSFVDKLEKLKSRYSTAKEIKDAMKKTKKRVRLITHYFKKKTKKKKS